MSDNSELMKLYSTRILALAADLPRVGRLNDPDGSAMRRSPLCGSQVTVDICMANNVIVDFAHDVKACALGQAAASIVASQIIGRTQDEITQARDALDKMLRSQGPVPNPPFEQFEVLLPAVEYKNRHASIMLSLEATLDAINSIPHK